MIALTKDLILSANDSPVEKVEIPCWGGYVYVKTMSARERDRLESSWADNKDKALDNLRARLAVATVCDEDGNLLFSPSDADALGQKSAKALDILLPVIQKLNGISSGDMEAMLDEQKKS